MNHELVRQAMLENPLTVEWMSLLRNYEANEIWRLSDESLDMEAVCNRLDLILDGLITQSLPLLGNNHIKDEYKIFIESILNEYKYEVLKKRTALSK